MAHPSPRLLPNGGERVLLIDWFQPTCDARARVLREHGIDVGTAQNLDEARVFFQAGRYDLVLLDLHRYPPTEALVFASGQFCLDLSIIRQDNRCQIASPKSSSSPRSAAPPEAEQSGFWVILQPLS